MTYTNKLISAPTQCGIFTASRHPTTYIFNKLRSAKSQRTSPPFFFASWHGQSCLFRLHILAAYFPKSSSLSATFWCILPSFILYRQLTNFCLYVSVLVFAGGIFSCFLLSSCLICYCLVQPVNDFEYFISTDCIANYVSGKMLCFGSNFLFCFNKTTDLHLEAYNYQCSNKKWIL
jgi:hypothetical protein